MIVAVDIGNSNIVVGIHDGNTWIHQWRIITKSDQEAHFFYDYEIRQLILENNISISEIQGIVLSSVVPDLKSLFAELLENLFSSSVLVVGPKLYEDLNYEVPRPYEIGTDIVANAYYAYRTYKGNCIVVDFGTALTFTTIGSDGVVKGVAIAPGIKTAMKALAANTAQLPEIPLELPISVLGMNTTHAMQAGILWGYVGIAKELLYKIRAEVNTDPIAIATGGLSFIMSPLKGLFHEINRDLTMNGLRLMLIDYLNLKK
jgi:type III pantothenate kinase